MLRPSTFKSSIRLYGLVKSTGNVQSGLALSTSGNTPHPVVQAFVSRLDAELMACTCGDDSLQALPLSQFFDPNPLLADNGGWLTLHIGCGFAAHRGKLIDTDGRLLPMGWITHADIGAWTSGHFLSWGEQLPRQLQATYDAAGLHDYNTQLNELDDAPAQEVRWNTAEALKALPGWTRTDARPSQIALFDTIACQWCFATSNAQGNDLRDVHAHQGGLS